MNTIVKRNHPLPQQTHYGTAIIYTSAIIALLAIVTLLTMIITFALCALLQDNQTNPLSWTWMPTHNQFGILSMLTGSLLLSLSALLLALPLAIAITCWITAIGQGTLLKIVNHLIRFMTTIPTVVYGFVALFLLTPLIRQALGGTGICWLTATLMVTLLILPTLILVMVTNLQTKLNTLCPSGLALGFSKLELLWFFVLPHSKKNILSAAILGLGRALGDTLLPLMLAGNATQVPLHLTDSLRTLTAHMALVTANEVGGAAYNSLFIAGFLLLLINALISIAVRRMGNTRLVGQTWVTTPAIKTQERT